MHICRLSLKIIILEIKTNIKIGKQKYSLCWKLR